MTECRGLGHSVLRKEDPRFIRGRGRYIDDIKLPGMLYLDIVRSPYAHATIKSINAEKALATDRCRRRDYRQRPRCSTAWHSCRR